MPGYLVRVKPYRFVPSDPPWHFILTGGPQLTARLVRMLKVGERSTSRKIMQNKTEFIIKLRQLSVAVLAIACTSCSSSSDDAAANEVFNENLLPSPTIPTMGFRLQKIDVDVESNQMINRVFKLVYNDTGLSVGELIDDNADGVDDHSFSYDYADNRLVGSRYDQDRNDTIDKTRIFTYDSEGFLQSVVVDDDSVLARTDYILGDDGMLSGARVDSDSDSQVDEVASYQYNVNGKISVIDIDVDGDKLSDTRVSFIYDDVGRVVHRERDVGVDRGVDEVWNYTYIRALCDPASNHQPLNHSCVY